MCILSSTKCIHASSMIIYIYIYIRIIYMFMLSLSFPVYQLVLRCFGCSTVVCMCDSAQPAVLLQ